MAGVRFPALMEQFRSDLEVGGAVVWARQLLKRPATLRVATPHASIDCLVYLWTVTPGGNTRSEDEWRIQVTGVQQFQFRPAAATLIGGWCPEFGVYAFWDATRHVRFKPGSPSFQIREDVLVAAGGRFATETRKVEQGREVVVAVSRDYLQWYVQEHQTLHRLGADSVDLPDLVDASPAVERNYVREAGDDTEGARRRDVVLVARRYRDQRFSLRVLDAYDHRCAVCGCQLRLVDAAHIVPVSEPSSTDRVDNGIALCRHHHAAYDTGLVGLFPDYSVVVNPERADALAAAGLAGGLCELRSCLPATFSVPEAARERPACRNLAVGLKLRGWPQSLLE